MLPIRLVGGTRERMVAKALGRGPPGLNRVTFH